MSRCATLRSMGKYSVCSVGVVPQPEEYEITATKILAEYFEADIKMVKRRENAKTADLKIKNTFWELKSPTGDGKHTMQNNLRKADNQSQKIVIDLRRCKMNERRAISRLKYELARAHRVEKLLVISKAGKVLEIK